MEDELRICSPGDLTNVVEYHEGRKTFTGALEYYMNEFVRDLVRGTNATATIYSKNEGTGELIDALTGEFSGCLGRLQKNESDMILRENTYPQKAGGIFQGILVADSAIQFISIYFTTETSKAAQMISSFMSFETKVWILCLLTMMAGYVILLAGRKMLLRIKEPSKPPSKKLTRHQRRHYYSYQVAVHMTARGSIFCILRPSRKVLFLTLSLFSLLVPFYFGSIIKTELVVADRPETLDTYQDLLDHNVSINFIRLLDTYVHFKFAPERSVEHQLWLASIRQIGEKNVLATTAGLNMAEFGDRLASRTVVHVTESTWATLVVNEVCSLLVDQENLNKGTGFFGMKPMKARSGFPYRSQDPRAKTLSKGFIFREAKHSRILRQARKLVQFMVEGGLLLRVIKASESMALLKNLMRFSPSPDSAHLVNQCEQNILILPEMPVHGIDIENMSGLLLVILGLHAVALMVMLIECSFAIPRSHA